MELGTYTYKSKIYVVIGPSVMKNPTTGEWQEAVLYSPLGRSFTMYVREQEDFKNKFTKVDKEPEDSLW